MYHTVNNIRETTPPPPPRPHPPTPPPQSSSSHHNEENDSHQFVVSPRGDGNYLRIVLFLILVAFFLFVFIENQQIKGTTTSFLNWVEHHPFQGVFVFILVYAIATVLFVPGSILTIGCGFAFGVTFGTLKGVALASISVFVGACLGSIGAFLLGRYLFRSCVVNLTKNYPLFEAIDKALEGNGIKIMILLRLSPLIPYNALDYMSGITAIPLWSYSLALVGIIPGIILFTFLGATASSLADDGHNYSPENKTVRIISMTFGIVTALLGVGVASYYAKRELDVILENKDEEKQKHSDVILGGSALDSGIV